MYRGQIRVIICSNCSKIALRALKFKVGASKTDELSATNIQQLQPVITDLQYVESVVGQYGIVAGSKCHEMLSRSIQRLTDM